MRKILTFLIALLLAGTASAQHTDVIRGTGVTAADDATFAAAVATMNAGSGGTIYIAGTVSIDGQHNFSKPVSIIGVPGTSPTIQYVDNAEIGWNRNFGVTGQTTRKISSTSDRASQIGVPNGYSATLLLKI